MLLNFFTTVIIYQFTHVRLNFKIIKHPEYVIFITIANGIIYFKFSSQFATPVDMQLNTRGKRILISRFY